MAKNRAAVAKQKKAEVIGRPPEPLSRFVVTARYPKTEIIGLRLDQRQRFLAEIAARQQRRSLSSFIDWAIHLSLSQVKIGPENKSVADMANFLWDVDEADRFAKLAFNYPHLLTHEEQNIWKLVWENRLFWRSSSVKETGTWERSDKTLDLEHLRGLWMKLVMVARGEASPEIILG